MAKKTNYTVNGIDYYRVRVKINGTEKTFLGSSKKEAEEKRDRYMSGINRGLSLDYDKVIFGDLFDTWFHEVLRPSIAGSTLQKYDTIYRLRIKPCSFFNLPLVKIRSIDIQKVYNEIAKDSPSKAIEMHKVIRHFLTYCIQEDYIIKDVLKNVKLPKQIKDESKLLFFDDESQRKLLESKDPKHFIFQFALQTGVRQGECISLYKSDVSEGIVNVTKSARKVKDIDTGIYYDTIAPPKTKKSVRKIPIAPSLQKKLDEHFHRETKRYFSHGKRFNSNSLLFSTDLLTRHDPSNLRRLWIACTKELGIPYVNFHGLRHTFCSNLAKSGVNIKYAAELMGHSDLKLTLQIYTHVTGEDLTDAILKMDQRMAF